MEQVGYLEQLIANCEAAKKAVCVKKFIFKNDSDLSTISSAIYIIKEKNGDANSTFNQFKKFKEEQTEKRKRNKNKKENEEKEIVLACPQLNSPSEILYVGSSTTNLIGRLRQHTTQSPNDTYALRLNKWFEGVYEIEIRVYKETNEVLQLIEDNLSFNLKPAFGKRGSNKG
ncbi:MULTISPECIES: hypothetical protein [Acinetobacter]|uniref:hypothetical protein n=1 Tax=Acinetobacter TaxID=469 RepID=UPI0002CDEC0B|nr:MULTISPECIES: hypothetical protein [Acinetobacter]ENX64478.1 hypothetical protein F885_00112 [Acinetobacter higginsii]MCH7319524.1 hypothetical protein [Acinetobacter higginsii]